MDSLTKAAITYRDACMAYTAAHALETAAHDNYLKSHRTPLDRHLDNGKALRAAAEASTVASQAAAAVEHAKAQLLAAAMALPVETSAKTSPSAD